MATLKINGTQYTLDVEPDMPLLWALRDELGLTGTKFGCGVASGGAEDEFTSFRVGTGYLNLTTQPVDRQWSWWGRAIFHVTDVDALYHHAITEGLKPDTKPRDAEWGERYFHITDPDGHELSFARPLGTGHKHQP